MPINNLNNTHLTQVQKDEVNDALRTLENSLETLTVTLTPEERQTYGSVNEQNKLLINKVWDYKQNSENLSLQDLDWAEFENDLTSRQFLESAINRLGAVLEKLKNAKTLHDYDNYQGALEDYAYTSYKAGSSTPGYETKRTELKQFFARSGRGRGGEPTEPTP